MLHPEPLLAHSPHSCKKHYFKILFHTSSCSTETQSPSLHWISLEELALTIKILKFCKICGYVCDVGWTSSWNGFLTAQSNQVSLSSSAHSAVLHQSCRLCGCFIQLCFLHVDFFSVCELVCNLVGFCAVIKGQLAPGLSLCHMEPDQGCPWTKRLGNE